MPAATSLGKPQNAQSMPRSGTVPFLGTKSGPAGRSEMRSLPASGGGGQGQIAPLARLDCATTLSPESPNMTTCPAKTPEQPSMGVHVPNQAKFTCAQGSEFGNIFGASGA